MKERTVVTNCTYPGYPTSRLVIENIDENTPVTLPDGEWSTGVYVFPTVSEQERLRHEGYELDDFGRPLHPWLKEMLCHPDIGVVTGMGEFWHWGPNRTGDPILISNNKVLLIKRSDTGSWALPGGFVDSDETGSQAARRELFEEAGVMIAGKGCTIYEGPVADSRTTAHAWPETTAVAWRIDDTPHPTPNDDAIDAQWFPIDSLPSELHGSHLFLIQKAIEKMDEIPLSLSLTLPEKIVTYRTVNGGHMAYDRFFIKTQNSEVFAKCHDRQVFTDQFREERSRKYLQKEKYIYEHIAKHKPELVPGSVRMIDDHSIVMEALRPEDGWHWRSPREENDRYINEVIHHLQSLQTIPLPREQFISHVNPTYTTHTSEGWGSIDATTSQKIIMKIQQFRPRLRLDFQHVAGALTDKLSALQVEFNHLDDSTDLYFCHHDLRPANLAWHPTHGTKIVDWSWAGAGRKNSDITTLLIDLHKSGHDVRTYMHHFNHEHALTLIGFWLAHSLWPTRTDDNSVRFHQTVSAISAYDLLMKYR